MEMIKNYQILKESINNLMVNSGLDIGAIFFILKDIYQEIEKIYFAQINKELMEEQNQQEIEQQETKEIEEKETN
jgi:hypothetical protein